MFTDFELCDISSFIIKKLAISLKKTTNYSKNVIAEEGRDGNWEFRGFTQAGIYRLGI